MLSLINNKYNMKNIKPWKWIVIDSVIIAGIAFLAALPGDRLPSILDLYVSLKSFLYSFLLQVTVERGIKPYINNKEATNGGGVK